MDDFQDFQTYLQTAYTYALPYIWPLVRFAHSGQMMIYTRLLPIIQPAITYCLALSSESPIIGFSLLLILAYFGLRVLFLVQRVMGFVTSLLFSAAFYGLIGLGVMYVYQRGVERTVYELGGVLQSVGNKWGSEYERWSEIQRQAGAAGGQQPMGGRRW